MSAPERIWATGNATSGSWNDRQLTNARIDYDEKLYIRADLAPQWQPIATAPKDGTRFMAYEETGEGCISECWWHLEVNDWEGWQNDYDSEPEPTHWMPLPTPPEPDT